MLKTGLALIGLALLVAGFAGGMYYERELVVQAPEPVVIPPYPPRMESDPSPEAPPADLGDEAALRALREILQVEEPFARAERLARQLGQMGPGDASVIPAVLDERDLDLTNPDYALLIRFWAQQDQERAARWAAFESPVSFRTTAIFPAMEEYAKHDPQGALLLMYEVDQHPNPYSAIGQIALVRGWYDSGVEGLEEYIHALGVGPTQQRAMAAFARRAIMRDGPDAIMAWAASLPEEDHKFKIMVYRQVGSELAQFHPPSAVAWCEAVCDGPFGSSVRTLIAQRWAAQDGHATMEWVKSAQPGVERDWAVKGAQRGWQRERPEEFDAWLVEETKDGTQIERWLAPVIGAYPASIARDPDRLEDALAWSKRIEDDEQRWRALVTVARAWYRRDPVAADAWIEQSELDEQGRAAARSPGSKNPYRETTPTQEGVEDAESGADATAEDGADATAAAEAEMEAPDGAS